VIFTQIVEGEALGCARGEVVVCIPLYGAHEYFVECLDSVLKHTSSEVPILVCDDASPDARSAEHLESLAQQADHALRGKRPSHRVFYLRRERTVGFPANVNGAFAAVAPADLVVINSDCVVTEGWLEGLKTAAYSDSRVATATALTNNGSIASLSDRLVDPELPPDMSLKRAAVAVRLGAQRTFPRLPTAIGHCMYVRRSALDLVGDFDVAFTPGYGEEVDFSQRCIRNGLMHVLADDVLVFHHGGKSFGSTDEDHPLKLEHEQLIASRYPYYHEALYTAQQDRASPLARSLATARRALKGLHIAIDARILIGPMTGTQLHVLEVIAAVARTEQVRLTVVVAPDVSPWAMPVLSELPGVELRTLENDARTAPVLECDLVHRPFQVHSPADLVVLARLGERLVITQQDLIGYHNPAYFRSFHEWRRYRGLTRRALASADRVLFFSSHARDDALREDLVEPHRADVVLLGVDHNVLAAEHVPVPPAGSERIPDGAPVMLCLGTDFRHKNRMFALRLLGELKRRHGWDGWLVLAGPRVDLGSSIPEEQRWLAEHPDLAACVLNLTAVTEPEKLWLLERTGLVLYPSVHEGFGLVPFEAADHGIPCVWAPGTSLSELLPDEAAAIVAWDPAATAERVLALLRDDAARERNLAAIREASRGLRWEAAAQRLLELYRLTCELPPTPISVRERDWGLMRGDLSEDAVRLVGPGGALAPEFERPLLALATHPGFGVPLLRAIRAGYWASYRLRRLRNGTDRDQQPELLG